MSVYSCGFSCVVFGFVGVMLLLMWLWSQLRGCGFARFVLLCRVVVSSLGVVVSLVVFWYVQVLQLCL